MPIELIQIRLEAAKAALQIAPHNLKESIQTAYCKKVTEEIEALLAQETPPQVFINYFHENAKLVRGTLLDYTAMPNHPTTRLLCTLAEWVTQMPINMNKHASA